MGRHTCIICGKKRDEKYMVALYRATNDGYVWICDAPHYKRPFKSCQREYDERMTIAGNSPCSRNKDKSTSVGMST